MTPAIRRLVAVIEMVGSVADADAGYGRVPVGMKRWILPLSCIRSSF